MEPNKRGGSRLPTGIVCSLRISAGAQDATLGDIANMTMDGVFVATPQRLPLGVVVPLTFALADGEPPLRPTAEVVHHDRQGMGLKFVQLHPREARRLRHYIADLELVASHRASAARLRDAAARATHVLDERGKIRQFLDHSGRELPCLVIPGGRGEKVSGRLTQVGPEALTLTCEAPCQLAPAVPVLVLQAQEQMAFSMHTTVLSAADRTLRLALPAQVEVAERRRGQRGGPAVAGNVVLSLPWRPGEVVRWPLCDLSPTGLSFRADPQEVYFWPGTELPGAQLERDGHAEPLTRASVRHLTAMRDDDGHNWLRVGLSFGGGAPAAAATLAPARVRGSGPVARPIAARGRVAAWAATLAGRVAQFYHRHLGPVRLTGKQAPFTLVQLSGRNGRRVAGLLNTTAAGTGPLRAPLVVVLPGLGGRKEASATLALVLVHLFARHGRDLAVLRLDGTNNLGESDKDPGCQAAGRHTLHFTVGGEVDDLLGALAWAQDNTLVTPTDVVLISIGPAVIGARHALTLPEADVVTAWLAWHGRATVADAYGAEALADGPGETTLLGCHVDLGHFAADLAARRLAGLEDAAREMGAIRAATTWLVPREHASESGTVARLLGAEAGAPRALLAVDDDPLAPTAQRDLVQGTLLARTLWRQLFAREVEVTPPSPAYVAAVVAKEWQRAQPARRPFTREEWRTFLLGGDGPAYDVCLHMPDYVELVALQVRLAEVGGRRVLDLAAGTGNVSLAVAAAGPASLTAVDLVPEALARLGERLPPGQEATLVPATIDGSARIAMRRFLRGELSHLALLGERLPPRHAEALATLGRSLSPPLYAVLRGATMDIAALLRAADLPVSLEPYLRDVQTLARLERGRVAVADAAAAVADTFVATIESSPGLPFAEGSFDAVICSLALPYLRYPDDAFAEIARVLAPGGVAVVSAMLPGATAAAAHRDLRRRVAPHPADGGVAGRPPPGGYTASSLAAAAEQYIARAETLLQLQRDGLYAALDGEALAHKARQAGLEDTKLTPSFGQPPQAMVLVSRRPAA